MRPRLRAEFLVGAALLLCWGLVVSSWLGRIISSLKDPGYRVLNETLPADITSHALTRDVQTEPSQRIYVADDPAASRFSIAEWTRDAQAEPSLPIYVAKDPAAGRFAVAEWAAISSRWTSNSSYADLLEVTRPVEALPLMMTPQHSERIIFILHTHPKMASTTLRRSCWENLRSTCNVVSPKRDPVGYSNAKELASLMGKCENTHHFCVMGWHFHAVNFPNISASPAKPITFLHLFPYRVFEDWAESALKQVFVGHAEAGCKDAAKRLETRCDGWLELDYTKYSKLALARMMDITKRNGQDSLSHHILLYDFLEVQSTLEQLSRVYHVPVPPYLETKHKQTRQEGSCSSSREILQKFHDCFDDRLATVA